MDPAKLKAAGFSDQEIRLAQAGFSDAEIQAAKAKPNAPAPRPTRTFGGALMEGAGNIIPQAKGWLGSRDLNPANIPQHLKGLAEIPGALVDVAGGVAQQVRELSPPEYRGTAPAMNKTSAQATGKALADRYGGKQQIYNTIATDPWGSALEVGSIAAPALAVTRSAQLGNALKIAPILKTAAEVSGAKAVGNAAKRVGAVVTSGSTAKRTAQALREPLLTKANQQQASLIDEANTTGANAANQTKAAALAEQLRAEAEAAAIQARQRAAFDEPAQIGTSSERSQMGEPVQNAAKAAEEKLIADRKAADTVHRQAMEELVTELQAAGKSVADTPTAKKMLAESKARLAKPDVTTSPDISSPAMPELAKIDELIAQTLRSRTVQLSEKEAKAARANGFTVNESVGPEGVPVYTRTFRTDFEALDNLGRRFGQAYGKDMEGFTALSANARREAQQTIQRIKEEFTDNASAEVQRNWREASRNLEKYEVGMGNRLTGTQGDTDIPNLTPNKVPGAVISGGREGYQRALNLTNNPATVRKMAEDSVENALTDPTTGRSVGYDVAARRLNKTDLSDMLTHPDLSDLNDKVKQHLMRLQDAKMAGVEADALDVSARTQATAAKTASSDADRLRSEASQLEAKARDYEQEVRDLKKVSDRNLVQHAAGLAKKLRLEGRISAKEADEFDALIKDATTAADHKKVRDTVLGWLGAGAIGSVGFGVTSHVFNP
jgi:hypothetical protein